MYDQSTRDASVLAADSFLSILLSKLDGCFDSVAILTGELPEWARAVGYTFSSKHPSPCTSLGLEVSEDSRGILRPLDFSKPTSACNSRRGRQAGAPFGREEARDPGYNLFLSQGEEVKALPPENLSLSQNWSHSRNLTQTRCQLATGYLTTPSWLLLKGPAECLSGLPVLQKQSGQLASSPYSESHTPADSCLILPL